MTRFHDPYARPSDALGEVERRIIVAAFAGPALYQTEIAQIITPVLNRPVLVASNDKADVLVVTMQPDTGAVQGLIGGQSVMSLQSAPQIVLDVSSPPLQQILLPRERLYFQTTAILGATCIIVSEVTP